MALGLFYWMNISVKKSEIVFQDINNTIFILFFNYLMFSNHMVTIFILLSPFISHSINFPPINPSLFHLPLFFSLYLFSLYFSSSFSCFLFFLLSLIPQFIFLSISLFSTFLSHILSFLNSFLYSCKMFSLLL